MDEMEDFVEYLPSTHGGSRPDLYVRKTRLRSESGVPYNFWGLFCHRDIKKGEFIGMYAGEWIHMNESFAFGNRYAIEVASSMMVSPPGQRPDPQRYPIAMANEPGRSQEANAMLREWVFGREAIAGIPSDVKDDSFHGVGLVACVDIPKDTEILWHYGPSYDPIRDYATGHACFVSTSVHPPDILGHGVPYDCVSAVLDSPSASDDSDADPSYGSWRALRRTWELQKYARRNNNCND